MTIQDAITAVDTLKPNAYSDNDKIIWLSRLDGMIRKQIIDTHEGGGDISFDGYDADTDLDTELLVPEPFDEVYVRWLEAQIDYANAEFKRYNNSIIMFNTAFDAYYNYYNRMHLPKMAGRRFLF